MILFTRCIPPLHEKPEDPRTFDPSQSDLLEVGSSLPYFKDYINAMNQVYLTDILEEKGPYTVFMPNQWAFSKFRINYNISNTDQIQKDTMTNILLYHIIRGRWLMFNFSESYHPTMALEITTGNPIDLYIENNGIFKLNGVYVMDEPDLVSINGIIHSINSVLKIPTIHDHLLMNEEFSMFFNILNSNSVEQEFNAILSQSGPFTLLAPTNEAFISFLENEEVWQAVDDIPSEILIDIIETHLICNENILLKHIASNTELVSMNGSIVILDKDLALGINKLNHKGKIAHVTRSDIQGINGVIHQIDQVLMP